MNQLNIFLLVVLACSVPAFGRYQFGGFGRFNRFGGRPGLSQMLQSQPDLMKAIKNAQQAITDYVKTLPANVQPFINSLIQPLLNAAQAAPPPPAGPPPPPPPPPEVPPPEAEKPEAEQPEAEQPEAPEAEQGDEKEPTEDGAAESDDGSAETPADGAAPPQGLPFPQSAFGSFGGFGRRPFRFGYRGNRFMGRFAYRG